MIGCVPKRNILLSSFVFSLLPFSHNIRCFIDLIHIQMQTNLTMPTLCILAEQAVPRVSRPTLGKTEQWCQLEHNTTWREQAGAPSTLCLSVDKWRERSPPQARIPLELSSDGQASNHNREILLSHVNRRSAFAGRL